MNHDGEVSKWSILVSLKIQEKSGKVSRKRISFVTIRDVTVYSFSHGEKNWNNVIFRYTIRTAITLVIIALNTKIFSGRTESLKYEAIEWNIELLTELWNFSSISVHSCCKAVQINWLFPLSIFSWCYLFITPKCKTFPLILIILYFSSGVLFDAPYRLSLYSSFTD